MENPKGSLSSQFASVYGSPGEAPRVLGLLRAFWPLLLVCLVTGYLLRATLPVPVLTLSHIGILFFLLAAGTGVLLAWGDRRLGNYLKGAKGEEWVAHELAFLPRDYSVFNGLRFGGGKQNFDHVIVGPSGVFVVETKNWKGSVEFREGKLYAGGKEPSRPPLRQVKDATAELVAFLDDSGNGGVPVHSVLCFISTELPEEVMNVNGVVVCTGPRLVEVLQEEFGELLSESTHSTLVNEFRQVINGE
jgi:hypothetical protein